MMMLQDSQDPKEVNFSTQTSHESQNNQQNNTPSEAVGMNFDPVSVSSNKGKKVTHQDIEVVQNLIERCLQLYMNRNEVVDTLLHQARIEPDFTSLVWQKLEEENTDFFKAYKMRLILKKQITLFNKLLERQQLQMQAPAPPKVPSDNNGIQHLLGENIRVLLVPSFLEVTIGSSSTSKHDLLLNRTFAFFCSSANNLPMGYTIAQQLSVPSTGHHQIDSLGMTSSHVINEMLPLGDLHSLQLNSGMMMNRSSAELLPTVPGIKLEMALSPTSITPKGQFPFTPTEISELSEDRSLDLAYSSHMTSQEGLLLEPDCNPDNSEESLQPFSQIPWNISFSDLAGDLSNVEGHGQLGNYSGSDILLESPEQNDIVEGYFLDNASIPASKPEDLQE